MKLPLFIRCDASTQIGMGHLVRCSALAEMLKEKFEITFFCKDIPASYKQGLKFNITQILVEDDFLQHVNDQSIVVLDGYHFKGSYQRSIKNLGAILVCIVDFPDYDFLADLIINHAPSVNTQ